LFRTAKEMAAMTAPDVPWIAKPWVAGGSITEIVGKVKQSGKTTFLARLVAAVLDGREFLGQSTLRSPVVFLTEQSQTSFREILRRAGLLGREDLVLLSWQDTLGTPWNEVAAAGVEEAKRRGARLLVVDTLGQFAGLRGDAENSAGDALEAIQPLQIAAVESIGVIVVRHERKSGGDVGDSGRGSSAFAGAMDIVLALRRPNKNKRRTIRQIEALSRFDETPSELMIELTDEGYVALGSQKDVAQQEARESILRVAPSGEAHGLSLDELLTRLPGVRRTVAQKALEKMAASSELKRIGAGKKGNPFRWYRLPEKGAAEDSSGRMPNPKGGRVNSNDPSRLGATGPTEASADWSAGP